MTREERSRAVAQRIRFRRSAGTSGRLQGCRPSAAYAAPRQTGLAPNVTSGSGVGTGRPRCRVGNRVARHPTNVVFRGRGRWTCPVRRPRSGMARTRETNDIDPLGRNAGDLVVRGGLTARSRLLLRVPWQPRPRKKGGPARGSEGFQACRKRRAALFPARGYAVLPQIAPSFHGFRCFGAESSSEQPKNSRDCEGATPMGSRGKSACRFGRRTFRGGCVGCQYPGLRSVVLPANRPPIACDGYPRDASSTTCRHKRFITSSPGQRRLRCCQATFLTMFES
jgi:hypothetical protein